MAPPERDLYGEWLVTLEASGNHDNECEACEQHAYRRTPRCEAGQRLYDVEQQAYHQAFQSRFDTWR